MLDRVIKICHTDFNFEDFNEVSTFFKAVSYTHLDVYKRQVVGVKSGEVSIDVVWI